jgi:beta-xylosidase
VRPLLLLVAVLAGLLAVPAGAEPLSPPSLPGPAYTGDFPDPHVQLVGSTYYAYSTTTGGRHLPVLRSTDLVTWTGVPAHGPTLGDALPRPASWSTDRDGIGIAKETWAPAVIRLGERYVAYYSVRVGLPHRFCLSVATSAVPEGPFVDATSEPLVCDLDPGGSIDPFAFVDPGSGKAYLAWKAEGHPGRAPQRLLARELQPSGLDFVAGSSVRELLRPSRAWEAGVVENPGMISYRGRWYLFYSGNHWNTAAYAEGVAVCRTPLGPCTKQGAGPLMRSTASKLGRAGASPFVGSAGRLRLAYHYWQAPHASYERGGYRRLGVATVTVEKDGRLSVRD